MRRCLPSLRPAAFPPPSPPPISVGFVRCFNGTMQPSDSSSVPRQLRLLHFLARPGITRRATAGQTRSPRFQRDPSVRDMASDPGRATVPRITAPHMLPSAIATASAPAISRISWLNPTPHTITVYASGEARPLDETVAGINLETGKPGSGVWQNFVLLIYDFVLNTLRVEGGKRGPPFSSEG